MGTLGKTDDCVREDVEAMALVVVDVGEDEAEDVNCVVECGIA